MTDDDFEPTPAADLPGEVPADVLDRARARVPLASDRWMRKIWTTMKSTRSGESVAWMVTPHRCVHPNSTGHGERSTDMRIDSTHRMMMMMMMMMRMTIMRSGVVRDQVRSGPGIES